MKRDKTQNTNLSSEFYIASQLLRLGYTTTITLGHTKEIDLLVAHPDGRKVSIDVKGLKNTTNWPLKPKLIREDHFFALVTYKNKFDDISVMPEVFIIPSMEIKQYLGEWTGRPDVTGVPYAKIRNSEYKNAWNVLFNEK